MKIIVCNQLFSTKKSTSQLTRATSFSLKKKLVTNEYLLCLIIKNDKNYTVNSTFYAESKSEEIKLNTLYASVCNQC